MGANPLALSLAVTAGSGLAFYAALKLPWRARRIVFVLLLAAVLGSPLVVPPRAPFSKFVAAVYSVTISVKLYDHFCNAEAGFFPGPWLYFTSLVQPFALVLRRVMRERRPSRQAEMKQFLACFTAGIAAVALIAGVFSIHWRRYPFIAEHCAKAISVFLMIQFLPNAFVPIFRLLKMPATNFAGPFFLARTPAEFWRLYNRPVWQFFQQYLFKPAGGAAHPLRATLLTFLFSGIVHEYVFDIPAPRLLGLQMLFFMIQGIAVMATIRLRPRGPMAIPATLLTVAFNLATVCIFLTCLNAVMPFYVNR